MVLVLAGWAIGVRMSGNIHEVVRDSLHLIDSTLVKAHRAASGAIGGEKSGDRREPGRAQQKSTRLLIAKAAR
jgi:hypothetical protein